MMFDVRSKKEDVGSKMLQHRSFVLSRIARMTRICVK